ncbi:glycosyltransferase family 2 protein [Castellaniella caeni]|uniref:glycosyltransferase family 2 protein n=1 Tax=Castellaniella caeni TaxID=266123 RepID=UPI0011AFB7BC|nr:glycosyltransferase family 2 protein [Castellaniella caeni]
MPAYNAARTLDESIVSVRAQTWQDWQLIIVVDAATDDTLSKAQAWAAQDGRITVIANETNLGAAASRNRALDAAQGEYITFLDSDDLWPVDKLSAQVTYMQQTGAKLTYTSYQRFRGDDFLNIVVPPLTITFSQMLKGSVIAIMTGMLHRDVLQGLRFRDIGHEDYLFWLDALRRVPMGYRLPSDRPMAFYRLQESSRSANIRRNLGWQWAIYRRQLGLSWWCSVWLMGHYGWRAWAKRRQRG